MRIGKPRPTTALDIILLTYQLASGSDSGASSAGWNTLPLNTEVQDAGNYCTLSSNQFALLAGTYELFDTQVRSFAVNGVNFGMNIRLRNITDSADVSGLACVGSYGGLQEIRSSISGRFTLAATKTLAIQAYLTAQTTFAWGVAASAGTVECYGAIGLRRLF